MKGVHVDVEVVRELPLFDTGMRSKLKCTNIGFMEKNSGAVRSSKLTIPPWHFRSMLDFLSLSLYEFGKKTLIKMWFRVFIPLFSLFRNVVMYLFTLKGVVFNE